MWELLTQIRDSRKIPAVPVIKLLDTRDPKTMHRQAWIGRVTAEGNVIPLSQDDSTTIFAMLLGRALMDQVAHSTENFRATYSPSSTTPLCTLSPEQQRIRMAMMEQLWLNRDKHIISFLNAMSLHVPCPGFGVFLDVVLKSSGKRLSSSMYKGVYPDTKCICKSSQAMPYKEVDSTELALALLSVNPEHERVVRVRCDAKHGTRREAVYIVHTVATLVAEEPIGTHSSFEDTDVFFTRTYQDKTE